MDEAEALKRLQAGEQSALDDLYRIYARTAIRTAYLITRNETTAEDAVQDAFVQVLRNINTLRDLAAFRPWFYRILVNATKRLARARSIRTVSLDLDLHDQADPTAPFPEEVALTVDELEQLRAAIADLNETHRVPVFLRYFAGLSDHEIAQVLGLPPGTVKSRLHNARKMLQQRLEERTRSPGAGISRAHTEGVAGR